MSKRPHPSCDGPGIDLEPRSSSPLKSAARRLGIVVASVLLWAPGCADVATDQDTEDQIDESPRLPLGPPTAVFAGEFGYLHAVRELPDGDVLVADLLDEAVFRVDMETQTRTMVGGRGEGPDEYLAPDAVWPLPGDSTLLVDVGSGRLVRIGPDLAFAATRSMTVRPETGSMVLAVPHAVDRHGYIYTTPEPWPPTGADTATILRIDPVRETVDSLRPIRTMWAGFFMPHDAWGVAADGSVVVARAEAYGVDWLSPDGSVIRGDTVPYAPVPVTTAEKAEYYRDLQRHSRVIRSVVIGSAGARFILYRRNPDLEPQQYDRDYWPDVMPAFHYQTVHVDPLDRAWVHRHDSAGGDSPYDIFDRQGRLALRVVADGDRRVVGFGAEGVYIAAFDDLDRVFLERHRLPGG